MARFVSETTYEGYRTSAQIVCKDTQARFWDIRDPDPQNKILDNEALSKRLNVAVGEDRAEP
jgi:hypothetical protein